MLFAHIENNVIIKFPISEKELRALYPNKSLPASITQEDLTGTPHYLIESQPYPTDLQETMDKKIALGDLEFVSDKWVRKYMLVDMIPVEKDKRLAEKWQKIRIQRNKLLDEASKRVDRYNREVRLGLPCKDDINLLDTYMQELADITKNPDPFLTTFPEPPIPNLT